jgi:SAM-dependent methyltransferase
MESNSPRSGRSEHELIDPKRLIEELSVEEFNQFSDDYYKKLPSPESQLGKPFSMEMHAPQLLIRLGLILESLRLAPGMKVLDFGAGTCWISKALWQMGYSVIATDVSEEALALGRRLFEDYPIPNKPPCNWETRLFDGQRLPVEDGEIDRIICFDAFHHVPNQEVAIKEFYRVLRNGGTIAFNEPLGPHSATPESQSEMREFTVLENDLDMEALKPLFNAAGFDGPTFKVAASPGYMLNHDEWLQCKEGEAPSSMTTALKQFQQNSGIFYFQKGAILNDSRQTEGLKHDLQCEPKRLDLKVGEIRNIHIDVGNIGESRWLNENETTFGIINVASRLLDFESRELLKDNTRFRFPTEMEPGERFEGDIPIFVDRPGRYWLKLDLVAELVCWFESVGSEAILIEVNVTT